MWLSSEDDIFVSCPDWEWRCDCYRWARSSDRQSRRYFRQPWRWEDRLGSGRCQISDVICQMLDFRCHMSDDRREDRLESVRCTSVLHRCPLRYLTRLGSRPAPCQLHQLDGTHPIGYGQPCFWLYGQHWYLPSLGKINTFAILHFTIHGQHFWTHHVIYNVYSDFRMTPVKSGFNTVILWAESSEVSPDLTLGQVWAS